MQASPPHADTHTPCLLCTHPHASRLRSLLDRLSPIWNWLSPLVQRLPPCPKPRVELPYKKGYRWILMLVALTLCMMILLTYGGPVGSGATVKRCSLKCKLVQPGDRTWSPRAVPLQHPCTITADLPIPCPLNHTPSEILQMRRWSDLSRCRPGQVNMEDELLPMQQIPPLLATSRIQGKDGGLYAWYQGRRRSCQNEVEDNGELLKLVMGDMPPINFLPNYKNPCWYEDIPSPTTTSRKEPVNPYAHNLFNCFSQAVTTMFRQTAKEYLARRRTQPQHRRLRCLPYFYIAGMPKCGSTDLYNKVMKHPDVVRPPMKEPHWWSKNRYGTNLEYTSAIPLSDYIDLFDKAALLIESRRQKADDDIPVDDNVTSSSNNVKKVYHPMITGDASASTFWDYGQWWRLPENCGRMEALFSNAHYIKRLTPHARIIVIFRDPTERLYSDYLFFTKISKTQSAFHHNVLQVIQKFNECRTTRTLRACTNNRQFGGGTAKGHLLLGLYHVFLSEWLKVFPRDQILVLQMEDYSKNLRQTLRQIYRFLGLRPLTKKEENRVVSLTRANTRKVKDRRVGFMWNITRKVLQDFYRPHNHILADILRDRRFLWGDVITRNVTTASDIIVESQWTREGN